MERVTVLLLAVVLYCVVSLTLAEVEMFNYFPADKILVWHDNMSSLVFLTTIIYDFLVKYKNQHHLWLRRKCIWADTAQKMNFSEKDFFS